MAIFWRLTDTDGDAHLFNVDQLCCCDLEKRSDDRYFCKLTFCDNVSEFYVDRRVAARLIACSGKVELS